MTTDDGAAGARLLKLKFEITGAVSTWRSPYVASNTISKLKFEISAIFIYVRESVCRLSTVSSVNI